MTYFRYINLIGATQKPRREMLNGREHLVVPVVMLVEGAIRALGSKIHELVRASAFKATASSWNGRPLVAGHPVENGTPISANDPKVVSRWFGHVLNTTTDAKRLLGEAWIDIEKAKSMPDANNVLERCLAHERGDPNAKPIEVSTGSLVGTSKTSGVHNGKSYGSEWETILPDHLAMLAEDKVGACSVAMGCGALRAAMASDRGYEEFEGEEEIRNALDAGPEAHECECRRNHVQGEKTMDRSKTIAALAAHPHSAIRDPKVLEAMEDAALKALEDAATAAQTAADTNAATIKAAKDGQAEAEIKLKAAQDALAAPVTEDRLPSEYRSLMSDRKAEIAKETTTLVTTLKAAQTAYTEDQLKAKPIEELRQLASFLEQVKPATTFVRPVPRLASGDNRSFKAPDPYKAGLEKSKAS